MSSGVVHGGCVYFWSALPKNYPRGCRYYVFSQWYMCSFVDPATGMEYSSAEQYMMAEKARLFGDSEILEEILSCHDPRKAKSLGRRIRGFDENVWEENRYAIVWNGNRLKFSQNDGLKEVLLGTGDLDIAEAAPNDRIWGIGLNPEQAQHIASKDEWRGLNLLGKALVDVRQELNQHSHQDDHNTTN